ncbi:hypothetical protein DFS34DRAFT_232824 [Phlyctochytrium arcticum]|nr:hypothetical protein DFS34DRAFT_232824 [Phlyctochytrium arcticum]
MAGMDMLTDMGAGLWSVSKVGLPDLDCSPVSATSSKETEQQSLGKEQQPNSASSQDSAQSEDWTGSYPAQTTFMPVNLHSPENLITSTAKHSQFSDLMSMSAPSDHLSSNMTIGADRAANANRAVSAMIEDDSGSYGYGAYTTIPDFKNGWNPFGNSGKSNMPSPMNTSAIDMLPNSPPPLGTSGPSTPFPPFFNSAPLPPSASSSLPTATQFTLNHQFNNKIPDPVADPKQLKRIRNTESARRCRNRRTAQISTLSERVHALTEENQKLIGRVATLSKENSRLESLRWTDMQAMRQLKDQLAEAGRYVTAMRRMGVQMGRWVRACQTAASSKAGGTTPPPLPPMPSMVPELASPREDPGSVPPAESPFAPEILAAADMLADSASMWNTYEGAVNNGDDSGWMSGAGLFNAAPSTPFMPNQPLQPPQQPQQRLVPPTIPQPLPLQPPLAQQSPLVTTMPIDLDFFASDSAYLAPIPVDDQKVDQSSQLSTSQESQPLSKESVSPSPPVARLPDAPSQKRPSSSGLFAEYYPSFYGGIFGLQQVLTGPKIPFASEPPDALPQGTAQAQEITNDYGVGFG